MAKFEKGHAKLPGAGRKKGTPNVLTRTATEIMARLGHDPIEGMVLIAMGEVPCSVCHGKRKTKYQPANGEDKLLERTCQSCYGSGKEKISPELKGKMEAELAKYRYPTLRQIEHTGNTPNERRDVQIIFIEAPKGMNMRVDQSSPSAAVSAAKPQAAAVVPVFTNGLLPQK